MYQTRCQAQPIKFIIKLYINHNTLFIKYATYQKTESSRAASLSKLDNMVNSNSISNTNYSEFFKKQLVLFHFHNPTCAYNHPYNLNQIFSSANSHLSNLPLIVRKIIFIIPTNTPFFYSSALFHFPIFAYSDPYNLHQKYFLYLSHLVNLVCIKEVL